MSTDTWTDGHGSIQCFTRYDGSRLRYFTAGSGPALVLMHTVRTQLDYFHRVIPQLWDSVTVFALDLPGMGWSDIPTISSSSSERVDAARDTRGWPGPSTAASRALPRRAIGTVTSRCR